MNSGWMVWTQVVWYNLKENKPWHSPPSQRHGVPMHVDLWPSWRGLYLGFLWSWSAGRRAIQRSWWQRYVGGDLGFLWWNSVMSLFAPLTSPNGLHSSSSIPYPFQHTRYLSFPWKICLSRMLSTSYSSTPSQYHTSFQHGITFKFQLCAYPLFKHWLPICPWISVFHPTIIIKQPSPNSHWSTCPIQMTSCLYLRIPQTLRCKISPSPIVSSSFIILLFYYFNFLLLLLPVRAIPHVRCYILPLLGSATLTAPSGLSVSVSAVCLKVQSDTAFMRLALDWMSLAFILCPSKPPHVVYESEQACRSFWVRE